MTRSFWAPAFLVIVAGLVLLLSAAGGWIGGEQARSVGDVVITEPQSISGTQFAPTAVVFGLVSLLGGVVLAVVRGGARRPTAAVVLVLGVAATVVVGQGISRAANADGPLTPAPFFAAAAAVAVALGAAIAMRAPQRPPQTSRYRVEQERPEDDEWTTASRETE